MNTQDFLAMVNSDTVKLQTVLGNKGQDYANVDNALACFEKESLIVKILGIDVTTPYGSALFTVVQKLVRLCNVLFNNSGNSNYEGIEDSFLDLHGYLHLAKACATTGVSQAYHPSIAIGNTSEHTVTFTYPVR